MSHPQLMRIAFYATGIDCLERVLNRIGLPAPALTDLSDALGDAENPVALERGLAGECCVGSDAFQRGAIGLNKASGQPGAWGPFFLSVSGLWDLSHLAYLRLARDSLELLRMPVPERIEAADAIEERKDNLPARLAVARIFFPEVWELVVAHARLTGLARAARTAMAVERYRLANGRLPEELSELVPDYIQAVPADPFDGRPIRYRKLANGYITYSIGDDCVDNGGIELLVQETQEDTEEVAAWGPLPPFGPPGPFPSGQGTEPDAQEGERRAEDVVPLGPPPPFGQRGPERYEEGTDITFTVER